VTSERGSGMDAVPPAKFRLSLLGRFDLTGPDGPVDLPSKKLAGLLAYLACSAPVPQPREKLATLLWGSHFEAQARQNLRQALFRLRQTLGQEPSSAPGPCRSEDHFGLCSRSAGRKLGALPKDQMMSQQTETLSVQPSRAHQETGRYRGINCTHATAKPAGETTKDQNDGAE
jgi:hypothetical protein